MATASLTIKGLPELERKLTQLPKTLAKKIVRKAVRAGGKVPLEAIKANARSMVGGNMGKLLAKHWKLRRYKRQFRNSFAMKVYPSEKGNDVFVYTSKEGRRSYIPHAIEYGHDGAAAIPFVRSGAIKTKARGERRIIDVIRTGIDMEARKR